MVPKNSFDIIFKKLPWCNFSVNCPKFEPLHVNIISHRSERLQSVQYLQNDHPLEIVCIYNIFNKSGTHS